MGLCQGLSWVGEFVEDFVCAVAGHVAVADRQMVGVAELEVGVWPAIARNRDHLFAGVDSDRLEARRRHFGDRAAGSAADVDDIRAGCGVQDVDGAGAQGCRARQQIGAVEQLEQRTGGVLDGVWWTWASACDFMSR